MSQGVAAMLNLYEIQLLTNLIDGFMFHHYWYSSCQYTYIIAFFKIATVVTIMIVVKLCTNGCMYVTANPKRDGRCMDDFIYCITYCTVKKWFLDWKNIYRLIFIKMTFQVRVYMHTFVACCIVYAVPLYKAHVHTLCFVAHK